MKPSISRRTMIYTALCCKMSLCGVLYSAWLYNRLSTKLYAKFSLGPDLSAASLCGPDLRLLLHQSPHYGVFFFHLSPWLVEDPPSNHPLQVFSKPPRLRCWLASVLARWPQMFLLGFILWVYTGRDHLQKRRVGQACRGAPSRHYARRVSYSSPQHPVRAE